MSFIKQDDIAGRNLYTKKAHLSILITIIEKQDQLVIQTPKEIKTKFSNPKGKFKPGSEARQYVVGSPRGGQGRGGEVETNIHLCQNHCHYNFVLTSSL